MAAELKEEVTCPVCLEMPRSGYLLILTFFSGFAKEGCPNRYETKKEAWQHQYECSHRPVPCFMGWCKDKVGNGPEN